MDYSLIVVGGGIAGLSTALSWCLTRDARREPVLVLEKEPTVGGCVTTFARKGWRFDTVQIIPETGDLLAYFGLEMPLYRYTGHYARLFLADPATRRCRILPVAADLPDFRNELLRRYPEDHRAIRRFFDYGEGLLEELKHLKTEPTLLQGVSLLFRCPKIIGQSGRTYRTYLDSFGFRSSELLEFLDIFSSFSGLSGNRCAALLTACAGLTTLHGAYRPEKGFITFPQAMGKRLEELGGDIRTRSRVDEILLEEGRVAGVRCGADVYRASRVVCSPDTFRTFGELLGPQDRAKMKGRWSRKLAAARPSPSSFTIHLGLDESIDLAGSGFDCGYNVLTTGRDAHEQAFDMWERGDYLRDENRFHLAVISPSAVCGGKPTLIIHVVPAAMADWKELRERDYDAYCRRKAEFAQWYIDRVEQYMLPGLRSAVRYMDVATPATYERYLGSTDGANFDMLPVPSNFGMHRLPSRTPVPGLFLPKFSHGIWPSMQAGLQMVDMITGGEVMGGNARLS